MKDKRKIGGTTFTKTSCHTTKSAAKTAAEKLRGSGKKARVVKNGTSHCVFVGGNAKKKGKK